MLGMRRMGRSDYFLKGNAVVCFFLYNVFLMWVERMQDLRLIPSPDPIESWSYSHWISLPWDWGALCPLLCSDIKLFKHEHFQHWNVQRLMSFVSRQLGIAKLFSLWTKIGFAFKYKTGKMVLNIDTAFQKQINSLWYLLNLLGLKPLKSLKFSGHRPLNLTLSTLIGRGGECGHGGMELIEKLWEREVCG